MANVIFTVTRALALPASVVFDELIDWKGHATWVPLTRVQILSGDGGPGTEFMRVDQLDRTTMTVRITKIGPVLTGVVDLTVTATDAANSRLDWVEDIRVPVLPQFLAKPVAAAARRGFEMSITRMAKLLAAR